MDLAAPTITGPTYFEFENGTVGRTIEYNAYDPAPKNWSVTVDGSDYTESSWNGGNVTVLLIYLITRNLIVTVPQDFIFVITVFNQASESASITTTVHVIQDVTAPEITQPANITYEEGRFGNIIRWNITESNPDFYNISRYSNELGTNFSVMETGNWIGDDIEINVDGLNASHWYIYTLFVNDTLGMNSTSSVNVTVLVDTTAPEISSPDDVAFEFGDTGFEIRWHAYDSNPKNYTINAIILFNDTHYGNYTEFHSFTNISQPSWTFTDPDGGDISISLDGLFLGNYTFIISAFDIYNHSSNDSVYVRIYPDIRAPVITASDNLVYEEGYTGYNITWDIDENNPRWYNLTFDGDVIMNGTWHGENFSIDVDGLDVGVHFYNMTLCDFFGQKSFAVIQVEVTPDAHNPIISHIEVIQTLTTQATNNLTVQAYVWDLNNIQDITIEWGVGDPDSTTFVADTSAMTLSDINDFFTANLGEYTYGEVVWYRISATDNSSVSNTERTEWLNVTVISMAHDGAPALLYGIVGILGGLSLLVFIVMFFRTKR